MTTITIELPEELAEEARSQGLLAARAVEAMIRDALRRRAGPCRHWRRWTTRSWRTAFRKSSRPSVKEAERIIVGLARHPWAPTVYPTRDAEVAIHFKSPDSPGSVVVLLDNHGRGECYACTGGHSRRARYDASSDLPDGFVMEQLAALMPPRVMSTRDGRPSRGFRGTR